MKRFIALVVVLLASTAAAQGTINTAPDVKRFQWGLEAWVSGPLEFTIAFNELNPVELLAVDGYVTGAPVASFNQNDNVSRQVLATLVNDGIWTTTAVSVVSGPRGMNHAVSPHLFAINLKQTGTQGISMPVHFDYSAHPVPVTNKRLIMHLDNYSYRANSVGNDYVVSDWVSQLDVEVQLTITYQTLPPGAAPPAASPLVSR